jgi:hypothetical protein
MKITKVRMRMAPTVISIGRDPIADRRTLLPLRTATPVSSVRLLSGPKRCPSSIGWPIGMTDTPGPIATDHFRIFGMFCQREVVSRRLSLSTAIISLNCLFLFPPLPNPLPSNLIAQLSGSHSPFRAPPKFPRISMPDRQNRALSGDRQNVKCCSELNAQR